MSTRPERPWREVEIADDRALAAAENDVRLFFGIGPPSPVEPPESRMKRILASLEPEISAIRWGEQIHGQLVASIACEPGSRLEQAVCVGRCDALITADVGVGLAVWTADCVPLLMFTPVGGALLTTSRARPCTGSRLSTAFRRTGFRPPSGRQSQGRGIRLEMRSSTR